MTQGVQVLHTLGQHGVAGRGEEKCRGCVRGIAEIGIQSDSQQSVWGGCLKRCRDCVRGHGEIGIQSDSHPS